jgi:hypothetical protein
MKGSNMTDEKINIAIAKACGWEILKNPILIIGCACYAKNPHGKPECGVPDYVNSLDAMHEAEKALTSMQQDEYWNFLWDVAGNVFFELCHVNALQRAEAFPRTLGKWEE